MGPDLIAERIMRSLEGVGIPSTRVMLEGRPVSVARTSKFRLIWLGNGIHAFLFIATIPPAAETADHLDELLVAARDYAVQNKGGLPRGINSVIAAVTVAIAEHAEQPAVDWARKSHKRQWTVFPWPVLVNATSGEVFQPKRMAMGAVYVRYLKKLVNEHVTTVARDGTQV